MTTYQKWREIKRYYVNKMVGVQKISEGTYQKIIDAVLNDGLSKAAAAEKYGVLPATFYAYCSLNEIKLPNGGKALIETRAKNAEKSKAALKMLQETELSAKQCAIAVDLEPFVFYRYCETNNISIPVGRNLHGSQSRRKAIAFQYQTIGLVEVKALVKPSAISNAKFHCTCKKCGKDFVLQYQKYVKWRDKDMLDDFCCSVCAQKLPRKKTLSTQTL